MNDPTQLNAKPFTDPNPCTRLGISTFRSNPGGDSQRYVPLLHKKNSAEITGIACPVWGLYNWGPSWERSGGDHTLKKTAYENEKRHRQGVVCKKGRRGAAKTSLRPATTLYPRSSRAVEEDGAILPLGMLLRLLTQRVGGRGALRRQSGRTYRTSPAAPSPQGSQTEARN